MALDPSYIIELQNAELQRLQRRVKELEDRNAILENNLAVRMARDKRRSEQAKVLMRALRRRQREKIKAQGLEFAADEIRAAEAIAASQGSDQAACRAE